MGARLATGTILNVGRVHLFIHLGVRIPTPDFGTCGRGASQTAAEKTRRLDFEPQTIRNTSIVHQLGWLSTTKVQEA